MSTGLRSTTAPRSVVVVETVDRRPPSVARGVARVALVVLAVWVALSAVTLYQAAGDLRRVRASLLDAVAAVERGDLAVARTGFSAAAVDAGFASARLAGPHVRLLGPLPIAGANLRAVTAIAHASEQTSEAAVAFLDAGEQALGSIGEDAIGGGSLGEVGLAHMTQIAPPLRELADALRVGTRRVDDTGSQELVSTVADARREFLDLAVPARDRVTTAAEVTEALPAFLGIDRPRRYLLGAGSLSELRGSGGLLGSYAVATVDAGRIEIGEFQGIDEIERTSADPAVAAPSSAHAERWAGYGGMRYWRNANLSSDVPATGAVLVSLWDAGGGDPLDGVILVDTLAFERLLAESGPVVVEGVTTLTAANVREFVGLEAYGAFTSQDERKLVLGAVATAAFATVAEVVSADDLTATVELVSALTREGSLRLYSRETAVQRAFERIGVAGSLPDSSGELSSVVVNNVAANKVDYFTRREVEHRIRLLPQGMTSATVEATFVNEAPRSGYPRYVLGPNAAGLAAGDNLSLVTLLCGRGCTVVRLPEGGTQRGTERDHPAVDVRLHVPSGEQRSVAMTTRTLGGWRTVDGGAELVVRHRRQPTLTDDVLRVVVEIPDGLVPTTLPEGAQVVGDVVEWTSDDTQVDVELWFGFGGRGR